MEEFAIYKLDVGYIHIGYVDRVVVSLKIVGSEPSDFGVKTDFTDYVICQLKEYFSNKRETFDIPLRLETSPFSLKVLEALKTIPYGETRTYGQIATLIGSPKAARAVGGACNKNPIQIIIPCHRVIGANSSLVGYAGGLELKSNLLTLERKDK